MGALKYICYPPAFIRDMRRFAVSEFSFFLLLLVRLLIGYAAYRLAEVYLEDWVLSVAFCVFSYLLYAYYKVRAVGYLNLFVAIDAIATFWVFVVSFSLYEIAGCAGWESLYSMPSFYWWLPYAVIYITIFHLICHDMDDPARKLASPPL